MNDYDLKCLLFAAKAMPNGDMKQAMLSVWAMHASRRVADKLADDIIERYPERITEE